MLRRLSEILFWIVPKKNSLLETISHLIFKSFTCLPFNLLIQFAFFFCFILFLLLFIQRLNPPLLIAITRQNILLPSSIKSFGREFLQLFFIITRRIVLLQVTESFQFAPCSFRKDVNCRMGILMVKEHI